MNVYMLYINGEAKQVFSEKEQAEDYVWHQVNMFHSTATHQIKEGVFIEKKQFYRAETDWIFEELDEVIRKIDDVDQAFEMLEQYRYGFEHMLKCPEAARKWVDQWYSENVQQIRDSVEEYLHG